MTELAQAETAAEAAPSGPPVSLVELIDRLVDPVEPPPVPLTPQTGGWVVVGVLLAVLLAWLVWRGIARHRRNAYRREALAALRRAGDDPARIAGILRRAALAAYPRRDVASLTGTEWLAFLGDTGGRFDGAAGEALLTSPYAPGPVSGAGDLARSAEAWIRQHRARPPHAVEEAA